tara:strand:+ start:1255 stop:1650 length:396 start_codon:yes stop_codon:yes gene_type:complete
MPNLYLKIDIDTEVFTESGQKMEETIESIGNIVIQYKGFSDVEFNYGIYVDKDDFIKDYELTISEKSPYKIRIKGLAKPKVKPELIQEFHMDKKKNFVLSEVHVSPFEILQTKKSKKPKKMECLASIKKPK